MAGLTYGGMGRRREDSKWSILYIILTSPLTSILIHNQTLVLEHSTLRKIAMYDINTKTEVNTLYE
jgi:hypothetical protein